MKHEGWDGAQDLGIPLDIATIGLLEHFEASLLERAVPRGMIAASDAPRIRERHILDCLRATPLLPTEGTVCDLGSGAGLPGMVLALLRPDLRFALVEVRRNRAGFLADVAGDLGLTNVTVHGRRLETFKEPVVVCLARAFGGPERSWEAAQRILEPQGRLIYWAGQSFDPSHDLPEGVSSRLFQTPTLARSGPLVIMTRQ
ncbi:MAG: 16S rRNA (guanine(527)-N(7))-methyltransferase RsmG [Actinomycetota bacterium]